jgi:hypothetical protein
VDTASGWFYVYYGSRIINKGGTGDRTETNLSHVARAPISGKMAAGTWQKWYNGAWQQSGLGGKESNLVSTDSSGGLGYTPAGSDYSPNTTGTVSQQLTAGTVPHPSDLTLLSVAWDAYIGKYIAEAQQNGTGPLRFYTSDDLATQKWTFAGDTGSGYSSAAWYRWLIDSGNKTTGGILGNTFRSYCAYDCENGTNGQYVNISVSAVSPAPALADPNKTYLIQSYSGRTLTANTTDYGVTSISTPIGSNLEGWKFVSNGDGSYLIVNAGSGLALGADGTVVAGRAWGAKPTMAYLLNSGPGIGQEWWIQQSVNSSSTSGGSRNTGSIRLVNRYSGLVLSLSSDSSRTAETTPYRNWTNQTGSPVGGSRGSDDQAISLVAK